MIKFEKERTLINTLLTEQIVKGSKYKVALIEAGETSTANKLQEINGQVHLIKKYYTKEALKQAVAEGVFEGCPAMLRDEKEHLRGDDTGINKYIGNYSNVYYNDETDRVEGTLTVAVNQEYSKKFKEILSEIWNTTKSIGLSIVGSGNGIISMLQDTYYFVVESIPDIQSIDVVPSGNAGGKILALIESVFNSNNKFKSGDLTMNKELKEKIFALLSEAKLITEGKTVENVNDNDLINALYSHAVTLLDIKNTTLTEAQRTDMLNEVKSLLSEATKEVAKTVPPPPPPEPPKVNEKEKSQVEEVKELLAEAKKLTTSQMIKTKLAECNIPQPVKDKLFKDYDGKILTETEFDKILIAEQDVLALLNPAYVNNQGGDVKVHTEAIDKLQKAFDWIMLSDTVKSSLSESEMKEYKDAGVTDVCSIRNLYIDFTGDYKLQQKIQRGSLAETISTTDLSTIFSTSMHNSLMRSYKGSAYNQGDWNKIATVVPRTDLKTNTLNMLGGYGDIPVVNEDAAYQAATTPGNEAQTYQLLKYGYTERVSWEAIINDNLKAISKIPQLWGEAAARTLYKYVFTMIVGSVTMAYDSTACYHADHSNLLTGNTLSKVGITAARIAMHNQTYQESSEKIGLKMKYILVPIELQDTAYELTTPAYGKNNQVPEFHQSLQIEPIVVDHLTDVNDWYGCADKSQGDIVELGAFMGRLDPEFFTADDKNTGAMFTNDQIYFKIKHVYGGNIINHRPVNKSTNA